MHLSLNSCKAQKHELKIQAENLINGAINAGRDLGGEELKKYNGLLSQIKNLDAEIERHESPAMMHPVIMGPAKFKPQGEMSVAMTLREAFQGGTAEERQQIQALASYLRTDDIRAAADLTPAGDGGYLIPSLVQQAMERNYSAFAPVVQVAKLFATDNGEPITYPVLSDSESAVQLAPAAATGADATVSGDAPPTDITGPKLGAWKVSSKPVFVPRELITDGTGGIDIVTEVLGALLARVVRFENLKFSKGNGTTEAEGFMTGCATYAAGAVPLDLDVALDLAYACPALYRPQGVFMMSDTTSKYLRKLKTGITGDKRQLWADADATKGTPATLHGYPVFINNDMDSVGADGTFAGKSPLAFGDFKRFVVRQAEQNAPYIYRYSVPAKDGSAVILFRRTDSKLLVPEAIVRVIN